MIIVLIFANNKIEVKIIYTMNNNPLILFWNIGKIVFEQQNRVDNPNKKYSAYFQYKYGLTECFSRENIHLMKKLYLFFPIFTDNFLALDWEHYLELLRINDKNKLMFYYRVALFCKCTTLELHHLINSFSYERI